MSKKPTHAERIKQLEERCQEQQEHIDKLYERCRQISELCNSKIESNQKWLQSLEHRVSQIRVTKDAIKEFAGICVNSATKALAITAGLQLTIIVVKYILQV